jgi:tetratricopeptide (TPR) repeat protein
LRDILDKPETADYAPAMSMLTDLYLQQQRWQPLSTLLERAKAKYPDDPHYRLAEAKMYKASGDRTKVLAVLEKAATDLPGSTSLMQDYLLALMENGQYARLLSVSQPYLDKSGYESWLPALRAEALAKSGDTGKADETFLAAMKGADSTQLVFVKERIIQAYGMNPAAEKLTGWLVSHPKDPMVFRVTGMLCLDRQDYAKAVEMFLKAIEYSADDKFKGETRRELALGYYQLGKFPQAEEAYMEALKASPDEATLKNNLAYMYANDVGQPDKALPYAEQAASAMSQNADVLDTYGWTLAKLSRYSDAERQLLRAVQVAETPSQALLPRYHLGFVYEQMGRLAEALRQYRQAGDILNTKTSDPLYKELNEAIKRAQQKQAGAPASRSAA